MIVKCITIQIENFELRNFKSVISVKTNIVKMACALTSDVLRELELIHETGYLSPAISVEEQWQQVNAIFTLFVTMHNSSIEIKL